MPVRDTISGKLHIMGPSCQKAVFRCKACGCTFLRDTFFPVLKCPQCGSWRVVKDSRVKY
jgi:DNA-directed RNA polymerase subunit RPC12/RpoP